MDYLYVRRMRLELTRRNRHYPLKVACLPIPPPAREKVPRTGLEPACLSTHAPETCASTNSATWAFLQYIKKAASYRVCYRLERKTGLEPATLTLARLCSTNWATSAITGAKIEVFFYFPKPDCTFLHYFYSLHPLKIISYFNPVASIHMFAISWRPGKSGCTPSFDQ